MVVKELTQSAQAAKQIRQILKKAYPTIKFSVRSRNFSMGDAVDISWKLGPVTDEIDTLVRKFQYGDFNGMEDIYECTNSRDDIPQAKYIHCQREYKTQEEIENSKLKNRDPNYQDLYRLERTFHHVVAKDLCKLIGIEYVSIQQAVSDHDCFNGNGQFSTKNLQDCVWAIVREARLMEGYKGLEHATNDNGQEIKTSFRAIQ